MRRRVFTRTLSDGRTLALDVAYNGVVYPVVTIDGIEQDAYWGPQLIKPAKTDGHRVLTHAIGLDEAGKAAVGLTTDEYAAYQSAATQLVEEVASDPAKLRELRQRLLDSLAAATRSSGKGADPRSPSPSLTAIAARAVLERFDREHPEIAAESEPRTSDAEDLGADASP